MSSVSDPYFLINFLFGSQGVSAISCFLVVKNPHPLVWGPCEKYACAQTSSSWPTSHSDLSCISRIIKPKCSSPVEEKGPWCGSKGCFRLNSVSLLPHSPGDSGVLQCAFPQVSQLGPSHLGCQALDQSLSLVLYQAS